MMVPVTTPRRVPRVSRPLALALGTLGCALLPTAADAHLVTTGLGPVYDGVSHVLVSPDDLVPIFAMALVAGLNGPLASRRTLFVLTGSWLVGGVAGFLADSTVIPGAATAASFLVSVYWPPPIAVCRPVSSLRSRSRSGCCTAG